MADAHDLSAALPAESFDVVFSISVFEHLVMPWKAVLELNRVLRPQGRLFICTHQTFPLHDTPWDFFRFSDRAWLGLLNDVTGFRILRTALGEPASVVARMLHAPTYGLDGVPAYLASAVLAERTTATALVWPVPARALLDSAYPA